MKGTDVKISLKYKFLAITAGIVLLIGLSMTIFIKTTLTQKLIIELQEKGIFMARHLARMSADYLSADKTPELQKIVNEYGLDDKDMAYAFIQDSQGNVLAHTFKSGFPVELKGISTPGTGQVYRVQGFVSDGTAMYDIAAPIMNVKEGEAHVGISEKFIRKSIDDIVSFIIKIFIGVLILGGGTALVFTRRITRPLSELVEAVNAAGIGNFDKKVNAGTKDEIDQLGISFNKMARDLKETTVSRDRLTVEVIERKRAEEAARAEKQECEKKNKEIDESRRNLKRALNEIFTLIESVIQRKDHSVRFNNPGIKKCYEIMNCGKKDCSCYGKEATRCWNVEGTFCSGKVQGVFAQKYGSCSHCEVYKEATKEPIYEIGENFNNMMHMLETKNRELEDAYKDLHATTVRLGQKNNELKEFAYIASHDLKEPLRMVTSYLQLLERKYKDQLDSDAREFIGFAVDGASRMRTLITDLLTYSRVSTHGEEFRMTDSVKVIENVLLNLHITIRERGAAVTYDPLPEIMSDETQLSQLFQNLIGNAIKFNDNGAPAVHVTAEEKGDEWLFSVRDNGIGIEPEYSEQIFGIFQRLHNKNNYPGTGIGLSVCKKIVERHGGRIWVESEPGDGSTFNFTINKNMGSGLDI